MYYLKLLKNHGHMERKQGSVIMCMTVAEFIPIGTIIPIVVDKYIISEAKVVEANIFQSSIKIILLSDDNMIPQFELINNANADVTFQKHSEIGTTQESMEEIEKIKILKSNELVDIRPVNYSLMKFFVPDILDYSGLRNLQLNVRFK